MWIPSMDSVVSQWFTSYEEARTSLEASGGFLLPYRNQFFVTSSAAIECLGLDPSDPDWSSIGWDWVRPLDPAARDRLVDKRIMAGR